MPSETQHYLSDASRLYIEKEKRKAFDSLVTNSEVEQYKTLCSELIKLSSVVHAQVTFLAFVFQERLPRIKVKHKINANSKLRFLKTNRVIIKFCCHSRFLLSSSKLSLTYLSVLRKAWAMNKHA